jgi:hypothetical protein
MRARGRLCVFIGITISIDGRLFGFAPCCACATGI